MKKERIQKLIAQAGICSRRKAEQMILDGRVKLNRRIVRELGTTADPQKDKIQVDDKTIEFDKKIYLLVNKPTQMITSHSDEAGRPVVYSLVKEKRRLVSAGRLDYNTEGALLLTNDGELVHKLTHPSSMVTKEYEVKVKGKLSPTQIKNIETGVMLDDGPTQPVPVEKIRSTGTNTWYHLILTEGRNREVRRIVEAVGASVMKLKRVAFAGLRIDDLMPGETRPLTAAEVLMLYEEAGLIDPTEKRKKAKVPRNTYKEPAEPKAKSGKNTPKRSYRPAKKKKDQETDNKGSRGRGAKNKHNSRTSGAGKTGRGRNTSSAGKTGRGKNTSSGRYNRKNKVERSGKRGGRQAKK